MPMYDSLADQIKYFLLNGGDYHVAPDLGVDVLDAVDAFGARFLAYPELRPPRPGAVDGALLADGLLEPHAATAVRLTGSELWQEHRPEGHQGVSATGGHPRSSPRPRSTRPFTRR